LDRLIFILFARYDVTPSDYVSVIVTDHGMVSWSVF